MVCDNAPGGDRERERLRQAERIREETHAEAAACNPPPERWKVRGKIALRLHHAGLTEFQTAEEREAWPRYRDDLDQRKRRRAVQRALFDADDAARRTRAEAQAAALPKLSRRCELVIGYVTRCGERGAVRDEIAEALELPIQTVCPLVKELERRGQLVPTSRTRRTRSGKAATVMVTPQFADAAAGGPTR